MNLNATLLAQLIVFMILVLFTVKFIWPPLIKALDERRRKIEEGLAAAEKSKLDSEKMHSQIEHTRHQLKEEATRRREELERVAQLSAEEIRAKAQAEYDRILAQARTDAALEITKARESLRDSVAALAVKGAEQILRREVNPSVHSDLLNQLKAEL